MNQRELIRETNDSPLLTEEAVAGFLDVHVEAVKALVDTNLLPCVHIGSRHEPMFRPDDVRFLLLK
jgi:hypothetical protein